MCKTRQHNLVHKAIHHLQNSSPTLFLIIIIFEIKTVNIRSTSLANF